MVKKFSLRQAPENKQIFTKLLYHKLIQCKTLPLLAIQHPTHPMFPSLDAVHRLHTKVDRL